MGEGSRAAYEKLVQEDSSMPPTERKGVEVLGTTATTKTREKRAESSCSKPMEELTRTDYEVARAMANDLARSPTKAGERIPQLSQPEQFQRLNCRGVEGNPTGESKEKSKQVYSSDGTQSGLSLAFQNFTGDNSWPNAPLSSPGTGNSLASFPAMSNIGYPSLGNPSSTAHMTPPSNSLDTAGAFDHLHAQSSGSKRKALFQDTSLANNDLETEAISGLELMANSPGLPPSGGGVSSETTRENETGGSSLFEIVVGEKKTEDRKKRKLVF